MANARLWGLKKSPWVFHVAAASCNNCDIEILDVLTPRWDVERFGIVLVGSPRHADALLITGVLNLVSILSPVSFIGRSILLPMFVMLAFAFLGAYDDWKGIRGKRTGEGMRARYKFLALNLHYSVAKARTKLGYTPAPFEEAVRHTARAFEVKN